MSRPRAVLFVLLLLTTTAPGCIAGPGGTPIALRDPYGLIDDVVAAGNGLRVMVVPAGSYTCMGDGSVTPMIPDGMPGTFEDAIVDFTLMGDTATDTARGDARVPVGDWTVFVRGKGVDPVSMRPDAIIAEGCTTVTMLGAGETREVALTLEPRSASGVCGDGILSPDEQCDTPGMLTCDAMCSTTAVPLNATTMMGNQTAPHLAARAGVRMIGVFNASRSDVGLRLLDASGFTITSPGALMADVTVDSLVPIPGAQQVGAPAVAPDGRIAIPVEDYGMPADPDVRVVFVTQDRTAAAAAAASVRMSPTMPQTRPTAAFSGTGSLLVSFEDAASATGISTTFFAAGAAMPSGDARPAGQAGASEPALTAHDGGFILAFTQGGDVFFQRFGTDGAPTDPMGRPVLESAGGTQDQPAIAAAPSGTFAVAWREGDLAAGDGAGSAIRARVFGADGMARGEAFVVNSTTAGDQAAPAVAAAAGEFCFAWEDSGTIRARVFADSGMPALNRQRPPTLSDFVVATGTATLPTVAHPEGAWLIGWAAPADGVGDTLIRRFPD